MSTEEMKTHETSVLIAGAGVVGLTLAIMLASQGVDVTICESRDERATSRVTPQLLLSRTMEIYRGLGLKEEIESESEKWYDTTGGVIAMETLISATPLATYLPTLNHRMRDVSPAKRVFLTQHMLMRILRQRARSLPSITIQYDCAIVELKQDDNRVIAKTNSGVISAKYCVGCDGATGVTRKIVTGSKVSGHGLVNSSRTIVFRADLKHYQTSYLNSLIYVNNPSIRGLVRLDKSGESGMLVVYTSTRQMTPEMLKDERTSKARLATKIVHDAIGRRDMKIDLLNGEDWTSSSETADNLQNGRIFLAGDAARQMAPTGGFAGNTGIQDAHNLAWKLAFVVQGRASPALLKTYHTERHAVGVFVVDEAYKRWKSRCLPTQRGTTDEEPELPDLNVELGQRYNNTAGVVYVSGAKGSIYEDPFWPTAFPGSRAPHVWLAKGDIRRKDMSKSLYDHFEVAKYVLLCSTKGKGWVDAAEIHCKSFPLQVVSVAEGEFLSKYKIRDTGAVLIRPDGVIGWKALNNSDIQMLPGILKELLCREDVDQVGELPQISRAKTAPDISGAMAKIDLEGKKSKGAGSLMRRMTTMRTKKKSIS